MLLVSDFESFKESVFSKHKNRCEKMLLDAQRYRESVIKKAEEEGKQLYIQQINMFKSELENLKMKQFIDIDQKFKKQINSKIKELEVDLKNSIKKYIEKNFLQIVECFSLWLKDRYTEGTVKTREEFFKFFKDYNLVKTEKIGVVFQKENMIITVSPEKILEEKEEEILHLINSVLRWDT